MKANRFYISVVKRGMDFLLSFLALILLSPIMLIVGILVRIKLGSPVIFKQERPGKDEKIFCLYKFRTMTDDKDEKGELLSDEVRLTRFGSLLRELSLDELPELWNIMKGEMSIVGPRPLMPSYLNLYNERQKIRHNVRPGLTGLAQVNGRNELSWEARFEYDVFYVENCSLKLDTKIFFKTIIKVVKREGISAENSATMEDFRGTIE